VGQELQKLANEISDYLDILRSRARIQTIIKDELSAIRDAFATPRRTEIVEWASDVEDEDLIQREDMVVTVSHAGYIKRVPLSTYRAQRRGGKGRSGMQTRDEDFVTRLFVANTHTPILFFSSRGQAYKEKVWRLPLAAPNARGKALVNMLPLQPGERITTIMPLPENESSWERLDVMFATASGGVRRNKLSDFVQVNRNGKIAMKLDEGDHIVGVETCREEDATHGGDDVLLTTAGGQCIRFPISDVRVFKGRDSTGVRGIALAEGDEVISMAILHHFEASPAERAAYLKQSGAIRRAATGEDLEPEEPTVEAEEAATGDVTISSDRYARMGGVEQFILTASEFGFGKLSSSFEFRTSGRGGKGIRATDPTKLGEIGRLVAAFPAEMSDQIMLVSDGGQLIRIPVEGIRIVSRASKGVRLFNTAPGEKVVSVEHIAGDDAEAVEGEEPSS
jgi:DNA gyrase subunit A